MKKATVTRMSPRDVAAVKKAVKRIGKQPIKRLGKTHSLPGHRWAFELPNGKLAYDGQDRTHPMLFTTRRAAESWEEYKALMFNGATLVKVAAVYTVIA